MAEKSLPEYAEWLFTQTCDFVAGVTSEDNLPLLELPEVAFAGRSNVGKSSLINGLTNRKALARTSNTPGRTQQINFFNLGGELHLADLPGYGYAKVSKSKVKAWTDLIYLYLRGRVELRRVFVLVDGRHGLKESDRETMKSLDTAAVSYQIVLTKADKVPAEELSGRILQIEADLKKYPAAFPQVIATSAQTKVGLSELRQVIAGFVGT